MRKLTKVTKSPNASLSPLLWLLRLAPVVFVLSQLSRLSKESALAQDQDCPECEFSASATTTTTRTTTAAVEDTTTIREWGCHRQEAPFVFVHIGKAGGGSVRARLAAAALDYKRPGWNRVNLDKTYYYPMVDRHDNNTQKRGQFFSSQIQNYVPEFADAYRGDFMFEGILPCAAKTPLGQAIACPRVQIWQCEQHGCEFDYIVYAGHNLLFSELHWLPEEYLVEWWNKASVDLSNKKNSKLVPLMADLLRDRQNAISGPWDLPHEAVELLQKHQTNIPSLQCPPGPLQDKKTYKSNYTACYQPKEAAVDLLAQEIIGTDPLLHSRLLASLPVLRVTVLREPFSWLMSKYFWHDEHPHWNQTSQSLTMISTDRGEKANRAQFRRNEHANKPPPPPFVACDDVPEAARGWAAYRARTYMAYLCGEFCLADPDLPLADIERQAAYNLRNAFAVVGLLQEEQSFYRMVSQRVAYMDTSLNPEVQGKKHPSGSWAEATRCKQLYQNATFQQALMEASPEVAALYRLYWIGVEVNKFQKQELEQCSSKTTTVS